MKELRKRDCDSDKDKDSQSIYQNKNDIPKNKEKLIKSKNTLIVLSLQNNKKLKVA